jgi:hypothetical protein
MGQSARSDLRMNCSTGARLLVVSFGVADLRGESRVEQSKEVKMSNAAQNELGSVVPLWRYPIKSMMGEELNATEVTKRGLLWDRAYALVDRSDGRRRPPRTRENGRASSISARLTRCGV